MTAYAIFRGILALVVGAVFYIVDRRGGTGLYRWWYGMTHEHPLPADVHKGFVYNRTTKNRVIMATVLSTVISILAVIYGQYNALLELGLWLASIPVIVAAFMLGPRVASLWGRRDHMYDTVDKWERGEIDISDTLKMKSSELAAEVKRTVAPRTTPSAEKATSPDPAHTASSSAVDSSDAPVGGGATTQSSASSATPTPPAASPEVEPDPQELVNRFINRGKP